MLVSSNCPGAVEPVALEMLNLLPSDSRIALDIAAVSPFLSASNIRNFLTDCSMDAPFSWAGVVVEGLGLWKLVGERIFVNPAVPVDGLGPCPGPFWCGILIEPEELVLCLGKVLDEESSLLWLSASRPSFRLRSLERVEREDLVRLWLTRGH